MGKYEPLGQFLRKQQASEVRLTFGDIERIVGTKLPPSAHTQRAWWSNNPDNSVLTRVWLAAGFRSEQVDLEARKLVFRRAAKSAATSARTDQASSTTGKPRHPLFGALQGLVEIMPGTDLAKPADPDWGKD